MKLTTAQQQNSTLAREDYTRLERAVKRTSASTGLN